MFQAKKTRAILLVAAVCVFLAATVVFSFSFNGVPDASDVSVPTNQSFSLNDRDYPCPPILQDLIDRGWTLDEAVEQAGWSGEFKEDFDDVDHIVTGYRLCQGDDHINAYLNTEDCRDGVSPGECRLRSLQFYGENVESFSLAGQELLDMSGGELADILGKPVSTSEDKYVETYCYALPERGISEISFTFSKSSNRLGQIFIIF